MYYTVYIYIYTHVYIYIYIYIERERERDTMLFVQAAGKLRVQRDSAACSACAERHRTHV